MKFRFYLLAIILCCAFSLATQFFSPLHPAFAETCNPSGNPTGAWVQSVGTYTLGDLVLFGPGCNQIQDGGPLNSGSFQVISAGPVTLTTAQCNVDVIFEGNVYFAVSIGSAASFGSCQLRMRNGDIYTGVGTGRARQLTVSGFGTFNLYPGQYLNLQSDGANWNPDHPIRNDGMGYVWEATNGVTFFIDSGAAGSDSNDGLAATSPFKTLTNCAVVAYRIVYTKIYSSVTCSAIAGDNFTEFVQVFYPINGGGTLIFNSATPGSRFTWTCPNNQGCLQFGDGALVGATDIAFVQNVSSHDIISGHNHSVFDGNTNLSFTLANSLSFIFSGDFDAHFNINNGFIYSGTGYALFGGAGGGNGYSGLCQACKWNINGAINTSAATTITHFFSFIAAEAVVFQGNVSFGTTSLTVSGGNVLTGNSVVNNQSGSAPPGGAPTPATGGQYCTSAC